MEEKKCSKCTEVRSLAMFGNNKRRPDGLQDWCRLCRKEYYLEHYRTRDKVKYRKRRKDLQHRNLNKLRAYLEERKCLDCGETNPIVLDFDHRDPSTKEHNVSYLIRRCSWATTLREIEKCDIVCANCHRIRSAERGEYYQWLKT